VSKYKIKFKLISSCSTIAASLCIATAAFASSTGSYGVIEIGSKGVRAYTFDLDRANHGKGCDASDAAYLKCLHATTLQANNVNPIEAKKTDGTPSQVKTFDAVIAAVVDMKTQLITMNSVSPEKIYVVGSSGVAMSGLSQREDLKDAVNAALNLPAGHQLQFVTPEQEATYAFQGVMAMVPAQYQAEREQEALVIDFGSGNTKGSFRDVAAPGAPLKTFSIDYGTKKVTDQINATRGSEPFVPAAEKYRETKIVPEMRRAFDDVPTATSRPRVYIIGGIAWALSNLSAPQKYAQPFPRVTMTEINALYQRLSSPDALTSVCLDNQSKDPDTDNICRIFSPEDLIGGMQLIKAYADETHFEATGKCVKFFRDSLYAWPMGYLKQAVNGDRVITARIRHKAAPRCEG
jgi:hypothetical protein